MSDGNSSSDSESDERRSDLQNPHSQDAGCAKASGAGAASAYARLNSQMNERTLLTPKPVQDGIP